MECIVTLSPFIPNLPKAIQKSINEKKSIKECFKDTNNNYDDKPKCFKCESTNYDNLKLIQIKSTSRCSDELIESHYFCENCCNV